MPNIIKILRSLTPGNRPSGRAYGELYVNTADGQLGVINNSNNPQDLIGVPIFSTAASYAIGRVVYYSGQLYQAITAVSAGAWNSAQWSPLIGTQGLCHDCGQLAVASATALSFGPYRGNYIRINGVLLPIPVGNIPGLSNTNIYANGSPNQNLLANTTYYVSAFNVSGAIWAMYWTIGSGVAHNPSQKAGNIGTETIWLSGTEYPQYSLIGMCRTNASAQFFDDGYNNIGVATWFNRRPRLLVGADSGLISGIGATSPTVFGAGLGTLSWGDAWPNIWTTGIGTNSAAGQIIFYNIGLNGVSTLLITTSLRVSVDTYSAGLFQPWSGHITSLGNLTEGWNVFDNVCWVTGASGSFENTIGGLAFI
jgi:hypothetical protein